MGDDNVINVPEVTIAGDPEAGRAYVDGEKTALTGDMSHFEPRRDIDHIDDFNEGYRDESETLRELARHPHEPKPRQDTIGPDTGTGTPVPDGWNPYAEEYERLFGETNKPDEEGKNNTPEVFPLDPYGGAGLD
jgi:hypothetical protein